MNEHNGLVPRDHWIEDWERESIINYFDRYPLDELTYFGSDAWSSGPTPSALPSPSAITVCAFYLFIRAHLARIGRFAANG